MVEGPGVVTGRYGTLGEVFYVRQDFWPLNTTLYVRDFKGNDPRFISYFLKGIDFLAYSDKAAVPGLNRNHLHEARVYLPASVSEQRRIAHILGTLDDKIELNRRRCATLEEMARAIFRSWFVDFDPVRAKVAAIAEGRDPERAAMAAISGKKEEDLDTLPPETLASLRATAALFPSSFTDSELAEVPESWMFKPLPEAIEVNPRRTLRKGQLAPYVDMASLRTSGACIASSAAREFGSGSKFVNGDTLLARITPCLENGKGAFVDLLEEGEAGWGSTEFIVLCPKPPLPPEFGYLLSRHEDFRSFAISNMSGTSGRQRVPNECLSSYNIAVPSEPVAEAFARVVSPMFKLMRATTDQSRTLAALRDTLLPKLLSGKFLLFEATECQTAS